MGLTSGVGFAFHANPKSYTLNYIKLGNNTVSFLRALLPILAVYKMHKTAANVSAMSEADMLHEIHG